MRNASRCDYERHLDKLRERYWPEGGAPGREEPEIERPGSKRQTRQNVFLDNPICPVFLAADHTFYNFVGGNDETQTITELITHLNEVNQIYRRTDFDEDGIQDNVAFTLARVTDMYKLINRTRPKSYDRNKHPKRPFSPGKLTIFTRKMSNFGTFLKLKIS